MQGLQWPWFAVSVSSPRPSPPVTAFVSPSPSLCFFCLCRDEELSNGRLVSIGRGCGAAPEKVPPPLRPLLPPPSRQDAETLRATNGFKMVGEKHVFCMNRQASVEGLRPIPVARHQSLRASGMKYEVNGEEALIDWAIPGGATRQLGPLSPLTLMH